MVFLSNIFSNLVWAKWDMAGMTIEHISQIWVTKRRQHIWWTKYMLLGTNLDLIRECRREREKKSVFVQRLFFLFFLYKSEMVKQSEPRKLIFCSTFLSILCRYKEKAFNHWNCVSTTTTTTTTTIGTFSSITRKKITKLQWK